MGHLPRPLPVRPARDRRRPYIAAVPVCGSRQGDIMSDVDDPEWFHVLRCDHVNAVAFSPDGKIVASGQDNDGMVTLWDTTTGHEIRVIQGHEGAVMAVAFNPEGTVLASGGEDRTIRLWDVATGMPQQTLTGHEDYVSSIAFHSTGLIASGSGDKTIKVWGGLLYPRRRLYRLLMTLVGHADEVTSVAFSPDSARLASGSRDTTVRLWGWYGATKNERTLRGHVGAVLSVSYSPDGQIVASSSADETIKLWSVETTHDEHDPRTLSRYIDSVRSVAFHPNGQIIAAANFRDDYPVTLWDVRTGRELRSSTGNSDEAVSVAFSPDGRVVACGAGGRFGGSIELLRVEK